MDRSTLARAMEGARLPALLLSLRRVASPWVTVLTYHRVAEPSAASELEEGVVDVTPDQFDRQMAYVARWFDIVGIDELIAFRRGGKLPKNPLLVTFDDGYLDNHDVALPILKRHGARAAFFIATSYIDERRLFWWDRLAWVVKRSTKNALDLTYPAREWMRIDDERARRRALARVLRVVKDHHGLDLSRFVGEVERAAGVALARDEERRLADALLLTWDHVRALRRAGMDVQSHTRTHRVLQTLRDDELRDELRGSRETLERELGEPVRAVSYPVGKPLAFTPTIRNAVREAGYELGFSNGTGVNHVWDFDPLDAKRISLDVALSDTFFRAMVALPYLAY
jgi:peptidoglycan/xylan/chitin deacetylase (PgdA/CDA1 family)